MPEQAETPQTITPPEQTYAAAVSAENKSGKKKNKKIFFVIAGIVVLLFLIGGAFKLGQHSSGQLQNPQNAGNSSFSSQNQKGQNLPGQPKMPANGPQNDETYITFSQDGKNWKPGTLVAKHASVPDIIQLKKDVGNFKKGELLIYYIDFTQIAGPGTEQIVVVASADHGKTWSNKQNITLKNKQNKGGAVDPSIVQLPDGKLRLYFFGSDTTQGDPGSQPGAHKVYSAISSDGVNFTTENGVRFAAAGLTDPEVISYKNSWYMYYSETTQFRLATSSDGLNFAAKTVTGANYGGVPGAVAINGGVRVWGCGQGLAEGFAPDGVNFTLEQQDIFNGQIQGEVCDPSVVALSGGGYVMAYKVNTTATQGGNQTMPNNPPNVPQGGQSQPPGNYVPQGQGQQ